MLLYLISIPFMLFITSIQEIQTDWSGGSGYLGPVTHWTDTYYQNSKANDTTPGEVSIDSTGSITGFSPYQSIMENIFQPYAISSCDLNGDELQDLAVACYDGPITVILQEAGITWQSIEVEGAAAAHSGIQLADMNMDGRSDVVVCRFDQGDIQWYRNTLPSDSVWSSTTICTTDKPRMIRAEDLDQDGDVDIACASETEGLVLCENLNSMGTSWDIHNVDPALIPVTCLATADLNNDGNLDLTAAGGEAGSINVYLSPTWTAYTISDSINTVECLDAGDLNGDGFTDLVAGSVAGWRTWLLENPGDPSVDWIRTYVNSRKTMAVLVEDLDGDGSLEIISSYPGDEHVSLNFRQSSGTWREYKCSIGTEAFSGMCIMNLNNDGLPDLAGASYFADRIAWCPGETLTTYEDLAVVTSSVLESDSLSLISPLYLELDFEGQALLKIRASDNVGNMGTWSEGTFSGSLDVSTLIEPEDTYFQYYIRLYTQEDVNPSVLYEVRLTDDPTGVAEPERSACPVVAPNPSRGSAQFMFSLEETAHVSLSVFDLTGRAVRQYTGQTFSQGQHSIDISGLSTGLYLLRAVVSGEPCTLKLVVTEGR